MKSRKEKQKKEKKAPGAAPGQPGTVGLSETQLSSNVGTAVGPTTQLGASNLSAMQSSRGKGTADTSSRRPDQDDAWEESEEVLGGAETEASNAGDDVEENDEVIGGATTTAGGAAFDSGGTGEAVAQPRSLGLAGLLAQALGEWQDISPEIIRDALGAVASPLATLTNQIEALKQYIESTRSLDLPESLASGNPEEIAEKTLKRLSRNIPAGGEARIKQPIGFSHQDIARYNMGLEAFRTNLMGQLAARQAMLNSLVGQLGPHLRLVEALTQSPGYVHPETAPGSIVSGRPVTDIQWISLGGIPNPEAVRDDPETWGMLPGLGVEAIYHHVLPRLEPPPLQLPTELPQPPKPSEVSLTLRKPNPREGGSSRTPTNWQVWDINQGGPRTFDPAKEERLYNGETVAAWVGTFYRTDHEETASSWESDGHSPLKTMLSAGPRLQAQLMRARGGLGLAEDAIKATMEAMHAAGRVFRAEDDALRSGLRHGSVFYVYEGEKKGWRVLEETNGARRSHSFERIYHPEFVKGRPHEAIGLIREAFLDWSKIVSAALAARGDLISRLTELMRITGGQNASIPAVFEQLTWGVLTDKGREATAYALYGAGNESIKKFWNNLIKPFTGELNSSRPRTEPDLSSTVNIGGRKKQ